MHCVSSQPAEKSFILTGGGGAPACGWRRGGIVGAVGQRRALALGGRAAERALRRRGRDAPAARWMRRQRRRSTAAAAAAAASAVAALAGDRGVSRRNAEAVDDGIAVQRAGEGGDAAHPRGARRVAREVPLREEVLQHAEGHAADAVADHVNRVVFVPLGIEALVVLAAEAAVTATPRMGLAVIDAPALEGIEYLAGAPSWWLENSPAASRATVGCGCRLRSRDIRQCVSLPRKPGTSTMGGSVMGG